MSNKTERLEKEVGELRGKLQEISEFLKELEQGPLMTGQILAVMHQPLGKLMGHVPTLIVDSSKGIHEVFNPNGVTFEKGDTVVFYSESMVAVGPSMFDHYGSVVTVTEILKDNTTFTFDSSSGEQRVGFKGKFAEMEVGDRIVMSVPGTVAIRNLGKPAKKITIKTPDITWNDVGGQQDAKLALIDAIEMPYKYADMYKQYGRAPVKGVLLYGPPGCGKTMLAKAAANSISNQENNDISTGFIYVKGPEILNKWVGESEGIIRSLFAQARNHKEITGHPALIFIDEADAILGRRGSDNQSMMASTIVPQFLSEMDGLDSNDAVMILATNRQDTLDPAIVRDGRINRKILVNRPDLETAKTIFKIHLKNKLLAKENQDVDKIVDETMDYMFSDDHTMYNYTNKDRETGTIYIRDMLNGAMLAGVTEKAATFAMYEDISEDNKKPKGILVEHITKAIKDTIKENRQLNHENELDEILGAEADNIVKLKKAA